MRRTAQSRLAEARLLAVAGRYQEAVQIYADACAQEPLNTPVFHEMLEVKAHFINVKSAAELMNLHASRTRRE